MTWFLVLFFAAGEQYVFYKPTFSSLEECAWSANYPPHIQMYSQQILEEYGKYMDVERVVCVSEDGLKKFLEYNRGIPL